MRTWMLLGAVLLLCGTLLGTLSGCGHDPNHDINREKAQEAAYRIRKPPKAGDQMEHGHGG